MLDGEVHSITSSAALGPFANLVFGCVEQLLRRYHPPKNIPLAPDELFEKGKVREISWGSAAAKGFLQEDLDRGAKMLASGLFKAAREMRDRIHQQEQQDALALVLP